MEPLEPPRLWCRMTLVGPTGEAAKTDETDEAARAPARDEDLPTGCTQLLEGAGSPDLSAVDTLARRALEAARSGRRLLLHDVDPDLLDLLRLAGLHLNVQGLVVQVEGKPEGGEQPLGVEKGQEEGHLGDLPA